MNHRILRILVASTLAWVVLAVCSGCAALNSIGQSNKAARHIQAGDYEAAIAEGTKAIELSPDNYHAYVNRGLAYLHARRYNLAEQDFRRAIALEPDYAAPHLNYVLLLAFMRREQEATEHAETFLRTHPDSALLNIGLAYALRRKDYPRAYEVASRSVSLLESGANPGELRYVSSKDAILALAYGIKAQIAGRLGRKDEASRSIEKAMSLYDDFKIRYLRASIQYIEGTWEQALQTLRDAYAQAQGAEKDSMVGVESRFLLGQCYQQLGRWREAQEAYEEFIAANPHEKEAFANLGLVKAKLGDSESAVADFSKALDLDPKFVDARRNRGTVYLGQKRYESTIEDFSAVLAEHGDDTGTLYKRAYAYCTNGDRKSGAKDLREVLRIEPKNDEAKTLLRECT